MEISEAIKELEERAAYWEDQDDPETFTDDVQSLLAAYETAIDALKEKQRNDKLKACGRLVELPLALGDKVYWIPDYESWLGNYENEDDCIYEASVLGVAIREEGFYINYEPDDDLAWDKLGSAAAVGTLDDAKRMLQRYKGGNTP